MSIVCIDGHNLSLTNGSGIATYSRSLLLSLRALGLRNGVLFAPSSTVPHDPLLQEILLTDARSAKGKRATFRPNRRVQAVFALFGAQATAVSPSGRVLWPQQGQTPDADAFWLSTDLFRIANRTFSDYRRLVRVDLETTRAMVPGIMHWTYPAPLYARGLPNIYTLHDLIPLRLPSTTLDDKARYIDLCRAIVKRADHIMTVSERTRQDVIEILGVEEDRVTSTWQPAHLPPGALEPSEATVASSIEDIFGLGWKDYFVFFGAVEPKKNVGRLVEAYLRSGVQTPLVIVGGRGWLEEGETGFLDEILALNASPAAARIHRYNFLPRPLLVNLLRGAKATLFPSLYEGFGLPVLESMLLGTPVLASRAGALPEVAGEAALLVDPYDVDDIAAGIRAIDADEGLRQALTTAGQTRALAFSPEVFQGHLKEIYQRFE